MRTILTLFIVCISVWCHAQQFPDRHNTTTDNSWLSCAVSANPNVNRGPSHWIKYDFNQTYALQQSKFWNVNAFGKTTEGAKDIEIDYSEDGVLWKNWGRYSLSQADGSSTYQGEAGPHFDGLVARAILITIVSNHGGTCRGLSEFKVECAVVTELSDDLNELLDFKVTVFPNPFTDYLKVSIDEDIELHKSSFYQLIDAKGSVVAEQQIKQNNLTISGINFPAGVYQLKIVTPSGQKSQSVTLIK